MNRFNLGCYSNINIDHHTCMEYMKYGKQVKMCLLDKQEQVRFVSTWQVNNAFFVIYPFKKCIILK